MKNSIHILPTENSSTLSIDNGVLTLHRPQWRKGTQYMYITSDEEIKEGDWYYLPRTNLVYKCKEDSTELNLERRLGVAKIILTTDQDLIKDGVQAITDEFLKWLVMNPTCEEVEVVRDSKQSTDSNGFLYIEWLDYKIILPKEEPTSCVCGANTSCQCEEPKEKTFEEILSKMTLVNPKHLRMTSNGHGEFPDGYMLTEDGVKYIVKQLKNK